MGILGNKHIVESTTFTFVLFCELSISRCPRQVSAFGPMILLSALVTSTIDGGTSAGARDALEERRLLPHVVILRGHVGLDDTPMPHHLV